MISQKKPEQSRRWIPIDQVPHNKHHMHHAWCEEDGWSFSGTDALSRGAAYAVEKGVKVCVDIGTHYIINPD